MAQNFFHALIGNSVDASNANVLETVRSAATNAEANPQSAYADPMYSADFTIGHWLGPLKVKLAALAIGFS